MKMRFAMFCGVLLSLFSPLVYGQATGSFAGTVSDKAGAVISGANITITSQDTGLTRETKTDDSGHYLVPLLPVSIYKIHVDAQGFGPAEQKDVRLQVDEHRELDFSLQPASVNQSVEVSATEVAVETANPTLGQVITSQEVSELPLNGRNFVQLATLAPGTTAQTSPVSFFTSAASSEAATRGSFSLSVGGSREQETDWLLDGNDNNQLDEGGIAIFSDIDDIQEFKVLTYNYSAEYGERAGPTVLVTTKSGSNQFHGSVFEFFRNTSLDAAPYFGTSPEKFNLNQFGGSIGGPIRKDKTFFFLDYQAKMQREGVTFTGYVPSGPMITPFDAAGDYNFANDPSGLPRPGLFNGKANSDGFGDLDNPYNGFAPFQCNANGTAVTPVNGVQTGGTACNVIPGSLVNGMGAKVASLYPLPNAPAGAVGYNYVNEPDRKLNEGTWDVRLDHNFSSKDSAFARFSYDQATNFVPGGSPTWSEANAFGSNQYINNHGRNAVLNETHVFSPTMINQAMVGYNRIFNHILSFGTGSCLAANIGIPGADLGSKCDGITGYPASLNQSNKDCISCGMTSFQMSSYFSVGDRGYAPYQGGTNVYSVSDTLDIIRGRHNIRVGAVYRANQMNVRNNAFQDGYVVESGTGTGDDIADLLLGSMGVFAAHDQTFLGGTTGRRWKLVRPFVQDDWRVSDSLTVNLGFAWALATPETEVENRQANFDIQNLKWYVPNGSPTLSACTVCVSSNGAAGLQFDKTALEPRFGFAWKPTKSDDTVVRGGYAIFHDSAWNQGGQGLWQNPPYYAEVDPDNFPNVLLNPYYESTGLCSTPGLPQCGLSYGFQQDTPSNPACPPAGILTGPVNPTCYSGTIQSANLNFKQGSIQQFNLNVQRQIPGNVVLTLGYAGSRSHHILVSQVNENLNDPNACPDGANPQPGYTLGCGIGYFPYAAPYQTVASNNSVGAGRYDSFQAKAETKSARHGLYALISYTYSRNFDSGLPDGLGTNPGALYYPLPGTAKLDWGLAEMNLNNNFTASVLYDLPFGKGKRYGSNWNGATNAVFGNWQLDLIEHATSGFPLFVVDSADESGTYFSYNGFTLQRPNQVGNPNQAGTIAANPNCSAPSKIHTVQNWFNPCAFEQAPSGELGTAARAPVYGPRFVNTDFSVIKDLPLPWHEGMGLQFRAEFFNLFNHPQFFLDGLGDSGEQDINTPSSFGVINNTVNNPRLVQFALKLKF
ncbi:MAG TPA: carboxypeptidase-like regulatory domain-containing protein [Candidatus Sulfotelmatobacter sp.]|nr:carboxypeptidase-like regulatory domain-containing protein [Candidatus Sulfotelmatobacter sp.]